MSLTPREKTAEGAVKGLLARARIMFRTLTFAPFAHAGVQSLAPSRTTLCSVYAAIKPKIARLGPDRLRSPCPPSSFVSSLVVNGDIGGVSMTLPLPVLVLVALVVDCPAKEDCSLPLVLALVLVLPLALALALVEDCICAGATGTAV
jgi:hypothetical protein